VRKTAAVAGAVKHASRLPSADCHDDALMCAVVAKPPRGTSTHVMQKKADVTTRAAALMLHTVFDLCF
jgi:hypothetical protein